MPYYVQVHDKSKVHPLTEFRSLQEKVLLLYATWLVYLHYHDATQKKSLLLNKEPYLPSNESQTIYSLNLQKVWPYQSLLLIIYA